MVVFFLICREPVSPTKIFLWLFASSSMVDRYASVDYSFPIQVVFAIFSVFVLDLSPKF